MPAGKYHESSGADAARDKQRAIQVIPPVHVLASIADPLTMPRTGLPQTLQHFGFDAMASA
jgi:hypothetical protein